MPKRPEIPSATIAQHIIWPERVPDLIKMLREDGWRLCRWHGGHRQYQHPVKRGTVTVSRSAETSLTRGALKSVLKQAGVVSDASA